jgi:hypothetical protein
MTEKPHYCATCNLLSRQGSWLPSSGWKCTSPQGQQLDVVTGLTRMAAGGDCHLLRASGLWCGPDGKWWIALGAEVGK